MNVEQRVLAATGATDLHRGPRIQSVWSGWGEIVRYELVNGPVDSVVVKHIQPGDRHPRGWVSSVGDARKRRSYEVEAAFYSQVVGGPRRPHAYLATADLFVLEDLDASGFSGRHQMNRVPEAAVEHVLAWLADFHAAHVGRSAPHLWPAGTYWHLATRPDEWNAMAPGPLKDAAVHIDAKLRRADHQTLVHGDAKVANFCFGDHGVAAVDFQYVGRGPGIVDVVYFLGSCFSDAMLDLHADRLTDRYFTLIEEHESLKRLTLSDEWRGLTVFAWADFERFLAGWAPEHHKRGSYAARQTSLALARLA